MKSQQMTTNDVNLFVELVSDTLEVVSRHTDFADVDSINFLIKTVVCVRDRIEDMDAQIFRIVMSGGLAPNAEITASMNQIIRQCGAVARTLSDRVATFTLRHRILRVGRIQEIANDPGARLHLSEINSLIQAGSKEEEFEGKT